MPRPSPIKKSIQYGEHVLTLETGEIARQASGAVMASLGDTVVLATVGGGPLRLFGPGFLSSHGGLPGKDLCGGTDPRRVLSP